MCSRFTLRVKSTVNFQLIYIKRLGFITALPIVRDLSGICLWKSSSLSFMKIQINTKKLTSFATVGGGLAFFLNEPF